jgi:hypothetical protein
MNVDSGKTETYTIDRDITTTPYEYASNAQKIDVHNHRRQGVLAIERNLKTNDWSVRLISTVLGMILVDAYGMYRHENESKEGRLDFRTFTEAVGVSLISNKFDDGPKAARSRPASEVFPDSPTRPSPAAPQAKYCSLVPLKGHPCMQNANRKSKHTNLRCRVCGKQTSWYCPKCSTNERAVPVCAHRQQLSIDDQCLTKHVSGILSFLE